MHTATHHADCSISTTLYLGVVQVHHTIAYVYASVSNELTISTDAQPADAFILALLGLGGYNLSVLHHTNF